MDIQYEYITKNYIKMDRLNGDLMAQKYSASLILS